MIVDKEILSLKKSYKLKSKAYYLATCNTCKRILKEVDLPADLTVQEIKTNPLSETQLEELKSQTGSYESLFNRRAQLYRRRGLQDNVLSEQDFKELILEHYTFLKRPVFVIGEEVFVGSSKKTIEALKSKLAK